MTLRLGRLVILGKRAETYIFAKGPPQFLNALHAL